MMGNATTKLLESMLIMERRGQILYVRDLKVSAVGTTSSDTIQGAGTVEHSLLTRPLRGGF
jgi:hypothetical protein